MSVFFPCFRWTLRNIFFYSASIGRGEQLLQPRRGRPDRPPVPRGQGGQPTEVQANLPRVLSSFKVAQKRLGHIDKYKILV
jgi:hypothetical protein